MSVDVSVSGAYTADGVPINVHGVANIKIDGDPPGLDNAVERLLGKSNEDIRRLARETLEGNLRGVLARLTPEQVNQDKEKFAAELIEEAEMDLQAARAGARHAEDPDGRGRGRLSRGGRAQAECQSIAPVDDLDRRTVVMRPSRAAGLVVDAQGRLVTAAIVDGRSAIIAANIDGSDVDRSIVLGYPRPGERCELHRISATPRGDIALHYVRLNMGNMPSCGVDVLAANGSGFRAGSEPVTERGPVAPGDPAATETRTVIP